MITVLFFVLFSDLITCIHIMYRLGPRLESRVLSIDGSMSYSLSSI
jgi:hypothetical protein